jgi:hypothetical protein
MKPDALELLIDDFEDLCASAQELYGRLTAFAEAVKRTPPDGGAEEVLLKQLLTMLDGARGRLGRLNESGATGAAGALQMALADLRKAPEFASAFAHIRRSKNMPEDLGAHFADSDEARATTDAYAVQPPKALREGEPNSESMS